jgi:hypothetical protein
MKAILGALLCYVLFASECFALKGGPFDGGGGGTQVATTGTFAGVLVPDPNFSRFDNSIGLFTVIFPKTGLSTGSLIIFQTGQTYTGTIQGIIDPKGSAISALLYATFPYTRTIQTSTDDNGNPVFTTQTVIAVASGELSGKVTPAARITGTADVQFSLTVNNVDSEVVYDVFGFKQA